MSVDSSSEQESKIEIFPFTFDDYRKSLEELIKVFRKPTSTDEERKQAIENASIVAKNSPSEPNPPPKR